MTLHFITTDAGRWGTGQERPLTAAELDETVWTLKTAIDDAVANGPAKIETFRVVANRNLWIDMDDGQSFGPYELPVAVMAGKGQWQPNTVYSASDAVSYGSKAYIVLFPHTSGPIFTEGTTDTNGNIVYSKIIDIENELPPDGDQGMVLVKNTGVSGDVVWAYQVGLMPPGGVAGQILHKKSADYADIEWISAVSLPAYGQEDVDGDVTLDYANGECQRLSVIADVTSLTISNFGTAGRMSKITLEVWNTGAYTFAFPAGTIWAGGTHPTLTSGADKKDIFVLFTMDGGTTIYGSVIGQNFA